MTVFVDTSGIIALMDSTDRANERATTAWLRLAPDRPRLVTTNYVVVEAVSLLHTRFGVTGVRRFAGEVLPALRVEWVDRATHQDSIALLLDGARRGPSLVDLTSLATMRRLGITAALAFDRHFDEAGYAPPGVTGTD